MSQTKMNISRRRKSHLSTVRTARSLAGLFIFSGFLMLILSATVGTLLFQTDIQGANPDALLDSPSPATQQPASVQVDVEPTDTPIEVIKTSIDTQHIKSTVRNFVSALEWDDLRNLILGALIMLWLGYVLRVMAVLAETQLIDFQQIG